MLWEVYFATVSKLRTIIDGVVPMVRRLRGLVKESEKIGSIKTTKSVGHTPLYLTSLWTNDKVYLVYGVSEHTGGNRATLRPRTCV